MEVAATSVRERMDHLYNNPDMSDLTIAATEYIFFAPNTTNHSPHVCVIWITLG